MDVLRQLLFTVGITLASSALLTAAQDISAHSSEITVLGSKYTEKVEGGLKFQRFESNIAKLPPKSIGFSWEKAQSTTGVRLRFQSDSSELKLKFKLAPESLNRGSQFGVFIDGKWQKSYDFKPKDGEDCSFGIQVAGKKMRHYEITLPSFSNPIFQGVSIDDGAILKADPMRKSSKVYVAFGDSITHGVGQGSATYQTYAYLLAKKLGYDYFNLAVGGGKISVPAAEQLKDWKKVDLITVLIGYNDWCFEGKSPETYRAKYKDFLQEIRKNHPQTEIYCISLLYTKNKKAKKTDFTPAEFRSSLESLVKELQQAGDKNLHCIEGDKITSEKNLQADKPQDPVHLGIDGASLLADELFKAINQKN